MSSSGTFATDTADRLAGLPPAGPVDEPAGRLAALLTRVATAVMADPATGVCAFGDALAAIGGYAGADRATVFATADGADGLAVAHSWAAPGSEPLRAGATGADVGVVAPWRAALDRGETVQVPDIAAVDGAGAGRGVVSVLLVPLRVDGALVGALRIDGGTATAAELAGLAEALRGVAEIVAAGLGNAATVAALVASAARYQEILDGVDAVVVQLGPDGRAMFVNRAWSDLTGISAEDTVGKDAMHHVHPDDRLLAAQHMAEMLSGSKEIREVRFLTRDGAARWMQVNAKGVFDADGNFVGFTGTLHDVTERRQNELRAHAARDRAEQAREVAERANRAKSEFLSRMSHELRTPLNAILGFAQLMEFSAIEGEDADNLDHIIQAGRHLLGLINDALDVDHIEAGRFPMTLEPVSVAAAVGEGLGLVRPAAAERSVTLNGLPPGRGELHVLADPQRLTQVLVNLLSNAVKYNRAGGTVSVDCYPLELETPGGHESEHGWLRIAVTDTGVGLPAERLADVFLPFERLGAEYTEVEGTGLGLALTKSMVEAMGGQVGVHSVQGVGATFQVDLPAASAAGRSTADRLAADAEPDRGDVEASSSVHTVLYVEDNPSNIMLVRRVLSRRPGVRLVVAEDGVAGLTMFRQYRPNLVLLDLHLPRLDGAEVLAAMRAEPTQSLRETPIVIVTADLTAGTERRLLDGGASAFLGKPLDVHHLLDVVDEYLASGQAPAGLYWAHAAGGR